MPSLLILATADDDLAAAWERQIPDGRSVVRLNPQSFLGGSRPGFSAVVVLDAAAESQLPQFLTSYPTIYVGEPRSLPYEQARLAQRGKVFLSYEDSSTHLRAYLNIMEELAEKQSMVEILLEKNRRNETPKPSPRAAPAADAAELWDFLEGAVENLDTRDRLIAEFRRASRQLLHASHAVFFLRESDGFRADRGTSFFGLDDPLVGFLERHPVVIDGTNWDSPADPVAELSVRNRLAMWGARLLVPIHDNGRLLGLIALGVRDDGQAYEDSDRTRAVFFARLLRHFLARSSQLGRLIQMSEQSALGAKYLPSTLLLAAGETVPRHVPLVVRDLIGRVRRSREVCRVAPLSDQPFRASAGLINETGGVWAFWEEASSQVHDAVLRSREERRSVLRELALTLSHELGNALVSLAMFRQVTDQKMSAEMLKTLKADIGSLERLNKRLGMMQNLDEIEPVEMDMRDLIKRVANDCQVEVEVVPDAVRLPIAADLLEFALSSLIDTLAENQTGLSDSNLALQLRSTGSEDELTALISIKGRNLELEGILPEPAQGEVPNQGRIAVFLAKEIIRLHRGEIHAGPGIQGTEILISIRAC
jgi:signal transduction histidine kinase